jgi:DNA modification methylase
MSVKILQGDCRDILRTLPDESVHCVVTSPPYFGLRDYGVAGQIGLENTLAAYIDEMVSVFREVRRVLRSEGTCWANFGDSYANDAKWGGSSGGKHVTALHGDTKIGRGKKHGGLKPKDLMMVPARVAIALQDDGWWLRKDIIWAKPNPMPESATDRPTSSHEHLFLLTKAERYFYDADAVREVAIGVSEHDLTGGAYAAPGQSAHTGSRAGRKGKVKVPGGWDQGDGGHGTIHRDGRTEATYQPAEIKAGRNLRDVWTIASHPFPEAHFACVDAETEALTPDGWKLHSDLTDGDQIAAYERENDRLTWQAATFHRYPYVGDLVAIEKRDASQRLTPNHRCLIKRRVSGIAVVEARDLKPGMQIPMVARLDVTESDGVGRELAALLGWYLAEGTRKRSNIIRIHQSLSANSHHVETIRGHLTALGASWHENVRNRTWRGRPSAEMIFSVRGDIAERLNELAPDKCIDLAWIKWPVQELRALLDALIDGDGHRRDDGRACIVQKDRRFLDCCQAIALRLGWRTHISPHGNNCSVLYVTKGSWLTLRGTNGVHAPIRTEPYEGTVWCPSIESSFWLARRRGRPFITGNTFPPKLVEPCVKAGTSEAGACPHCGAPWARLTAKGEPDIEHQRASGGDAAGEYHGLSTKNHAAAGVQDASAVKARILAGMVKRATIGWLPTCACPAHEPAPCVVLDPFGGSGTTALVADRLGRSAVLIELNPEYVVMARARITGDAPLFADCTSTLTEA